MVVENIETHGNVELILGISVGIPFFSDKMFFFSIQLSIKSGNSPIKKKDLVDLVIIDVTFFRKFQLFSE